MESCKDKAGAATGLPDLAELQTEAAQQCSPVSFATLPTGSSCPYSGSGQRTFTVGYTQYDYYFNKYGHGRAARRVRRSRRTCRRRSRRRCRSSGPRTRWASRATPSSARAASRRSPRTPGRAGDEVEQLDLRAQRPRLQGHRAHAQGGAGAGRRHGEGLGLLGAVLRQAADQRGRQRRRGPVRVAQLPARSRTEGPNAELDKLPQVRQEARRLRRAGVGRGRDLRPGGQRHDGGERRRPELDHPGQPARRRSGTSTTSTPAA